MIINYPSFIFIRHAESEKNLHDITGGTGERLTDNGVAKATEFSMKLVEKLDLSKHYTVVSSNTIQTIDTAKHIASRLNTEVIISDEISPAGLGIAGGLSGSQLAVKFPVISERLNAWRRKEIEAVDLQIPGMEQPEEFWRRVLSYLFNFGEGTNNIIVCTRSIMVLVANLVSGKHPYKGGGYKHINIKHCDTIAFKVISEKLGFFVDGNIIVKNILELTTVDLGDASNE